MDPSSTENLQSLAHELALPEQGVARTVALLDEGNTIPFITRYRRDQTGGLNEEQIERIQDAITRHRQLAERKESILRSIEAQNQLTDALRQQIERAQSLKRLEDLYLPYRPKKQSLAAKAREQGLEPLTQEILSGADTAADLDARAAAFMNPEKGIADASQALQGAGHIVAELWSENADLRQRIRKLYRKTGRLISAKVSDDNKNNKYYQDYLDYREPLQRLPAHRVLAINRGERAGVLRVRIDVDESAIERLAVEDLVPAEHRHRDFLIRCVHDALARLILPSLEREARREWTEKAEEHAVHVFAQNLRKLLLQPPVPGRRVLAIDPGFKNGCKISALDEFGCPIEHALVWIIGDDAKKAEARQKIVDWIGRHQLSLIAIGNGKACRDIEELVAEILANESAGQEISYVIVNEAGASVYSTSEIGREELPNCDAMQRSAVSIGRRLQDPLSELVKIDPASIGVGLYQHDAKAKHLRDRLDSVVRSCVSFVGVDLNSASAALLRYVSGLNQLTARRIYEHRLQHGPFKSRRQLLEVNGIGEATFIQAAGFLKIEGGDDPFDATWIHPENYDATGRLLSKLELDVAAVRNKTASEQVRQRAAALDSQTVAAELGIGILGLQDIVEALCRPGRDPREDLPLPIFRKDVVRLDQLEVGMELRGAILNVVDFGAFVDVGLADSGLVHISQMSTGFVRDPHEVVSVGDQVRVWVTAIDKQRRRVALSMIPPGTEKPRRAESRRPEKREPAGAAVRSEPARATGSDTPRPRPRRHDRKPQHERRPADSSRSYEKRAAVVVAPITQAMEEGKEAMHSFAQLMQLHKKKKDDDQQHRKTPESAGGEKQAGGEESVATLNGGPRSSEVVAPSDTSSSG